ncbi:uncharacterized protein LOC127749922 [Frankliniella occidentalis]|uniref:Uncharacterized protein LOC127749922 n=1 Tax=Frankliniella occidentalis TaxID=133901 RepID=A0A9C6X0N8_FRAOC|nr:uncharacterized protein LOC127749922 [Frankliniella occidentalis]
MAWDQNYCGIRIVLVYVNNRSDVPLGTTTLLACTLLAALQFAQAIPVETPSTGLEEIKATNSLSATKSLKCIAKIVVEFVLEMPAVIWGCDKFTRWFDPPESVAIGFMQCITLALPVNLHRIAKEVTC